MHACTIEIIVFLVQVYVGTYRGNKSQVNAVSGYSGLSAGQLVAVHCEQTTTQPSIGMCLQVDDNNVTVSWMKGNYSTRWTPWKVRKGRKNVDWIDTIPTSSIMLYDFTLTPTGHLRKTTIEHLQSAYSCLQ